MGQAVITDIILNHQTIGDKDNFKRAGADQREFADNTDRLNKSTKTVGAQFDDLARHGGALGRARAAIISTGMECDGASGQVLQFGQTMLAAGIYGGALGIALTALAAIYALVKSATQQAEKAKLAFAAAIDKVTVGVGTENQDVLELITTYDNLTEAIARAYIAKKREIENTTEYKDAQDVLMEKNKRWQLVESLQIELSETSWSKTDDLRRITGELNTARAEAISWDEKYSRQIQDSSEIVSAATETVGGLIDGFMAEAEAQEKLNKIKKDEDEANQKVIDGKKKLIKVQQDAVKATEYEVMARRTPITPYDIEEVQEWLKREQDKNQNIKDMYDVRADMARQANERDLREAIRKGEAQDRITEDAKAKLDAQKEYIKSYVDPVFGAMASSFTQAAYAVAAGEQKIGYAAKAMLANTIMAFAQMAAVKASMCFADAAIAFVLGQPAAAAKFTAAGVMYLTIAGTTAALGGFVGARSSGSGGIGNVSGGGENVASGRRGNSAGSSGGSSTTNVYNINVSSSATARDVAEEQANIEKKKKRYGY